MFPADDAFAEGMLFSNEIILFDSAVPNELLLVLIGDCWIRIVA